MIQKWIGSFVESIAYGNKPLNTAFAGWEAHHMVWQILPAAIDVKIDFHLNAPRWNVDI